MPEAGEEGEAKSEGGKFERGGGGRGRDGPGANNPGRRLSILSGCYIHISLYIDLVVFRSYDDDEASGFWNLSCNTFGG